MKPGQINKLKKAMGARFLDLIPPDQHKWQMGKDEPPLHRMWSCMCSHTIHWTGQELSAFAVDKEGNELYIEHLAKELWGEGQANLETARHYWRLGKERGLWRNGTKEEGKRRLYLCGEVVPGKPELSADPEKSMYILIPDQILKKTKDWPAEKLERFRVWYNGWAPTRKEVRDTSIAELVGVARSILDRDDDSALLTDWGIPSNRQEHRNGKSAEEAEASQARITGILASVDKYVHTVSDFVQGRKNGEYKPVVQTENASATLFPPANYQKEPEAGRQSQHSAPPSNGKPLPNEQRRPPKQLPTPQAPVSAPIKLTEAESAFFAQLASWKNDYEHCDFGAEEISRLNKGQVATVRRICATVKDDTAGFFPYVSAQLEKLNVRPAMGKRVGRVLGLILEWAGDYARSGPERARKEKEKREAFARAAENSAALNKQLDQQAIDRAIKILKDPDPIWSENDRQHARETLEAHGIQFGVDDGAKGAGA